MLAAGSIGRAPYRINPDRRRAVGERRRDTFVSERAQSMPTRWRFVTMLVIALLIMIGGVAVVTRLSGSESVDLRGHISVGPADRRSRRDCGCCVRRSEEQTSEIQSLMRISYAVFCLTKKKSCNIREYNHK